MIRVALPFTNDGKVTVVVGLSSAELEKLMILGEPVTMPLEDIGIEANLVLISRPSNDELIHAVTKAVGSDGKDGDVIIVDKRNEMEMVKNAMARKLELNREQRRDHEQKMTRFERKRRSGKKKR